MNRSTESPGQRLWATLYADRPIASVRLRTPDAPSVVGDRLARMLRLQSTISRRRIEDRSSGRVIRVIANHRKPAWWFLDETLELRGEISAEGSGSVVEAACFAANRRGPRGAHAIVQVVAMSAFALSLGIDLRTWLLGTARLSETWVVFALLCFSGIAAMLSSQRAMVRQANTLADLVARMVRPHVS